MAADLADRHPARIHRDDLVVEIRKPTLVFGDQFGSVHAFQNNCGANLWKMDAEWQPSFARKRRKPVVFRAAGCRYAPGACFQTRYSKEQIVVALDEPRLYGSRARPRGVSAPGAIKTSAAPPVRAADIFQSAASKLCDLLGDGEARWRQGRRIAVKAKISLTRCVEIYPWA